MPKSKPTPKPKPKPKLSPTLTLTQSYVKDCERVLDYFGFPDRKITIPKSDPDYVGKRLAYSKHRISVDAAPAIVDIIEKALLDEPASTAERVFVVDASHRETTQFGEQLDHVR